jgi:hypothetical protein
MSPSAVPRGSGQRRSDDLHSFFTPAVDTDPESSHEEGFEGQMSRFSKTRRTALAGGAALVLGSAAAHAVRAQQAAVPFNEATSAPDRDVFIYSSGAPIDLAKQRANWLKSVADKLGLTPDRLDKAMQDAGKDLGLPPLLVAPMPFPIASTPVAGSFSLKIDSGRAVGARAIGITEDQLRAELGPGKSITDIAQAHKVDPKVVAEAVQSQRRAELDKAVADGRLPADVAERLKSHLDREIDQIIQLPGLAGDGQFAIRIEHAVTTREP